MGDTSTTNSEIESTKIFLKDYQSPAYAVDSIHLSFNLYEDKSVVSATTKYSKIKNEALLLNGDDQKIISIELNGETLSANRYQMIGSNLRIENPPETFTLNIVCEIDPESNKSLSGLYKSKGIFCTQCEAEGFRKITYFMDRPDVMTKYSVDIEADKKLYPVLLSNGDRVSEQDLGNGRHRVSWRDPHKKPSYLFALVAGDLGMIKDSFTTASGRQVNLEIYAAHGKQDRCTHAMDSVRKAMKWDEETFGLEYDLNDYMIVAIDDFNAGAMENKGLNIFNSRLVLADPATATDTDYHMIESVVAHEYFHNWTGNRITCKNWFQLSLKEGLTVYRDQEFSADVGSRGVQRIGDVDGLRLKQFTEDSGPNAHPVRPESCMAVDNFYTATIYEKGAAVIRMMEMLVGKKGFRKGMDLYFKRHDGQAVTTEDFVAAIADANDKDFTQFRLWYSQAGTPSVEVTEAYDASKKEYTLTLRQSCPPTPGQTEKLPFHMPLMIGLISRDMATLGQDIHLACEKISQNTDGKYLVELKEKENTFVFKNVLANPLLSLNREFSAPIHLKWNAIDEDLIFAMTYDSDSFNRREASQKLFLNELQRLVRAYQSKSSTQVKASLTTAYKAVVNDTKIDPAFKALMLELPSTLILAQMEDTLDAEAFDAARSTLRLSLAQACQKELTDLYLSLKSTSSKDLSFKAISERSLKNQVLRYLGELKTKEADTLSFEQFQTSANMTDQFAALAVLDHCSLPHAEEALTRFYQQWKDDSLVMNKWFSVQALSNSSGLLDRIQRLSRHQSFDLLNPNNAMSLLLNFANNVIRFHDESTNPYPFYAEQIAKIDSKNPLLAARLCSGFNFVKKLKPAQKEKALIEIKSLLKKSDLSKNSRELLQGNLV